MTDSLPEAAPPPTDLDIFRYAQMAADIHQCVYLTLEAGHWWPTEGSHTPSESDNGQYYVVFPDHGKIERREVETRRLLEEFRWSEVVARSPGLLDWPMEAVVGLRRSGTKVP